jgi:hypothetical protein
MAVRRRIGHRHPRWSPRCHSVASARTSVHCGCYCDRVGGLRPARETCVSSLLFTPDWVDSAEADKVGSQESASARTSLLCFMRACEINAPPGCVLAPFRPFFAVFVIAGCGSYRRADPEPPAETSSFRIGGKSATSDQPAICVPVAARPAHPTAYPSPSPSPPSVLCKAPDSSPTNVVVFTSDSPKPLR